MPSNANNPKISNFEEMLSKTKDMAQMLNKRSAQCIEVSRKKVEYLDAKSKLSKAYEKFGKLQYKASLGEDVDENEYAVAVADIAALISKIDDLSKEIDTSKVMRDTEDLKRGAEELKDEVISASKEAREVIAQRSKKILKAVKNSVEAYSPVTVNSEIEVEFKEDPEPSQEVEKEEENTENKAEE